MRPVNWGRIITAMVTPFDRNLEVDYAAAKRLAQMLVANGTDAVLVNGTTGESPSVTSSEKIKLLEAVLEAVGRSAPVIAGTGTNSTADSVHYTQAAEAAGAHGIMLVAPYYNKPPQKGLEDHFARIAGATRLPVMLYNVPGRTSVNLLPATVEKLAAIPNIVALKEASGNLDQITEAIKRVPADFLVYSGDDGLTLPVLSVGGHGIVSVAAHVAGTQMKKMIDMYIAGNVSSAAEMHRRLFPLFKGLFMTASPIPVKAALEMIGENVGKTRPPLCNLTADEERLLRAILQETGVL